METKRLRLWCTLIISMAIHRWNFASAFLFYPRGSSLGYLAAVAMPLDLPYRDVYVAFNFEANYGLPTNRSYLEWVDRWDLDTMDLGIGNNVTKIDGRRRYTRAAFYRSFVGYANHFEMNGSACLLRTVCEVAGETHLDAHNGLLGSIFKILFMPSTSEPEESLKLFAVDGDGDGSKAKDDGEQAESTIIDIEGLHAAEFHGRNGNCLAYKKKCPHGILDMISEWL